MFFSIAFFPIFGFAAEKGFGPAISVSHDLQKTGSPKPRNLIDQTHDEAFAKSRGCLECHKNSTDMHNSPNVVLGCTDCHGGNSTPGLTQRKAHVPTENPVFWESSANPSDSTVLLNHESAEFIRFVNPGDLRVAKESCGSCHAESIEHVQNSMMNHGAMLWGAALYNNGAVPHKNYRFGQAYGLHGEPLRLKNPYVPTAEETRTTGVLPFIEPLPRYNLSQPGNILRIFERGGEKQSQLGIPNAFEAPGKPGRRLSERGLGTLNRTDPVFLGLQKTRLHDPLLGFIGSNDHPGDYRSSGCTACHVVYANDRSPSNSGRWSKYGNQGLSFSDDPMISKKERGHPIKHEFTRSIPSSQCMNCHMHQGNLFVNPYLGYMWWDQESEGEFMYPKKQKNPTDAELVASLQKNPEAAAARGLWGDLDFLEKVAELNPKLKETQFADYHGHGWIFRAVFKKDRKGNLLDLDDKTIPHDDDHKFSKAVHLKDIHLSRGMQCVDCHFETDVHGNRKLYGEPRAATTIECIDCHGTIDKRPTLVTTGNAGKIDLSKGSTPWGARFEWRAGKKLIQHSMMSPEMEWEVPQTRDTIDPTSSHYNAKSRYAKTIQRDGKKWGDICERDSDLAHGNSSVGCQVCHTSWATSCFGCHLPMKANQRVQLNKFEGVTSRNYTSYNPQVVRDDVFMLGKDSTVKSNRLAVLRSSSAVVVSSQNPNREWSYSQQQTVSAEGYSGQAFNPHFAHTTSGVGTTKNCTDCHLSAQNDNNAIMTQLLGFGNGSVNFFGRYAYVGEGKSGLDAVVWTEQEEPQAAIGSHLHKLAYPDNFQKHLDAKQELETAYHHHGEDILDLTLRGEYLYTANGPGGFEVFDVANIDQKGFSERIVSAPVSPLGQRTYVRTKFATSVTLPSTLGIDPLRTRLPENEEQPISLIYAWVFVTDREEGLVMVSVGILVDGNPANNFLDKEKIIRFNPDGKLTGAMHSYMAGTNLYVVGKNGLFVLGLSNTELVAPKLVGELLAAQSEVDRPHPSPLPQEREQKATSSGKSKSHPAKTAPILKTGNETSALELSSSAKSILPLLGGEGRGEGELGLKNPRAISVQFRYAFVTDDDGLKVIDISEPTKPRLISGAIVPLKNAGRFYIARTYAYVANGPEGLAIIDIENPEKPKLDQMFNAGGALNDTRAVQIGAVNASMFALVADGKNGLRVLQLISPENVPGHMGFSPRPNPKLIASYKTHGSAVAVSRGLDRDRVADETGNQTVVFGRRGSRPFNYDEMQTFFRHFADPYTTNRVGAPTGAIYKVDDLAAGTEALVTKTGASLPTPIDFTAEREQRPEKIRQERLMQRGK
ncbi:MAG: hypothetical protein ABI042_06370 [Verrucomicrobiota bacterium]